MTPERRPEAEVEVRRSRRRRRTVSAFRENGKVVVLIPARLTRAEEREWVATMVARLERSERRRQPSDSALSKRAAELSARYLDGLARPKSVRWVDNQTTRWGSCTPADKAIRLSDRLQGMPAWVVDYVLVHELAHLIEAGHTTAFWALVDRYPRAERAKGFLEGVALGVRQAQGGPDSAPEDPAPEAPATGSPGGRAVNDELPVPDGLAGLVGLAGLDEPVGGAVHEVEQRALLRRQGAQGPPAQGN